MWDDRINKKKGKEPSGFKKKKEIRGRFCLFPNLWTVDEKQSFFLEKKNKKTYGVFSFAMYKLWTQKKEKMKVGPARVQERDALKKEKRTNNISFVCSVFASTLLASIFE